MAIAPVKRLRFAFNAPQHRPCEERVPERRGNLFGARRLSAPRAGAYTASERGGRVVSQQPVIWVVGSLNADLVLPVERMPLPGETVPGGALAIHPGGKGANQACAAGRLGARVRMVGNVGQDHLGALLLESLSDAGVDTAGVHRVPEPTGVASIYVLPDGENAIAISPGANGALAPEDVETRLLGIAPGDFLLCQLEVPIGTVAAALRIAREAGATTLLDPAPAAAFLPGLLEQADYLTPNETEAAAILACAPGELNHAEAWCNASARLRAAGARSVVLKLGAAGCYLDDGATQHHAPGYRVAAVDTTAAGDTFNGAFATLMAEGAPVAEALDFACAAAALSVTRPGAQSSMPVRSEVESLRSKSI
ncbi:MAG: ribokinase [Candidatus Hydrogenedens sp.]|nr:ribokinase [Candidatus Hydrogenedens sp.]